MAVWMPPQVRSDALDWLDTVAQLHSAPAAFTCARPGGQSHSGQTAERERGGREGMVLRGGSYLHVRVVHLPHELHDAVDAVAVVFVQRGRSCLLLVE